MSILTVSLFDCINSFHIICAATHNRSNKQVPSPLATIPVTTQLDEEDVEYLTDIRVYDTQGLAWYGVRNPGEDQAEGGDGMRRFDEGEILQPEGRYGTLNSICVVHISLNSTCIAHKSVRSFM